MPCECQCPAGLCVHGSAVAPNVCRHAKRKVITAEDVKLCCRRNSELVIAIAIITCHSLQFSNHMLHHTQVDLVSGWHDNLKSKKESAAPPQGDKARGGKGKGKGRGRQVVLEDSDSDMDT